jgi:hAT family C-terminal dimerisation region
MTLDVLDRITALSKTLQFQTKEYSNAMQDVQTTVASLQLMLENIKTGQQFGIWWAKTEAVLAPHGIQPDGKLDGPTGNSQEQYRDLIAVAFLQALIENLEGRFNMRSPILERVGDLLPRGLHRKPNIQASDFVEVLSFYATDIATVRIFEEQFLAWKLHWSSQTENLPFGVEETLQALSEDQRVAYSTIVVLLQIHGVVPVTTASAERSFSKLKIIDNRLRTKMSQERLNALALISFAKDRRIDTENVARKLLHQSRRKFVVNGRRTDGFAEDDCIDVADIDENPPLLREESGFFEDCEDEIWS